jgi:salicylate hydroxylase
VPQEPLRTIQNVSGQPIGKREEFDLVVGCDGIHSSVRAALHGFDTPRFTGNMCWRALIPVERLPPEHIPADVTIWTGPGGHIVTFHIRGGALVNLVAVREVTHSVEESWSTKAGTHELVAAYPGVHKDLRIQCRWIEHQRAAM